MGSLLLCASSARTPRCNQATPTLASRCAVSAFLAHMGKSTTQVSPGERWRFDASPSIFWPLHLYYARLFAGVPAQCPTCKAPFIQQDCFLALQAEKGEGSTGRVLCRSANIRSDVIFATLLAHRSHGIGSPTVPVTVPDQCPSQCPTQCPSQCPTVITVGNCDADY